MDDMYSIDTFRFDGYNSRDELNIYVLLTRAHVFYDKLSKFVSNIRH